MKNEEQLLGAILIRPTILAEIVDEFSDELFSSNINKSIARATVKLLNTIGSFDSISVLDVVSNDNEVSEQDKSIMASHISSLMSNIESVSGYEYHFKKVQDNSARRKLEEHAINILTAVKDENVDVYELTTESINALSSAVGVEGSVVLLSSALSQYENKVREYAESDREFLGESTGFHSLDSMLSGIQGGHFGVVSAYTSTGKTFWALNIMWHYIKMGKSVEMFSLEMSAPDIVGRLLSIATGVDSYRISRGNVTEKELIELNKAKELIRKSNSHIHTNNNWTAIKMQLFKMSVRGNVDLIILDYLQLIKQARITNLYESMLLVSHELQYLLQKFNIPMIALSQISNESNKVTNDDFKTPKGAGDIAASADWVGLLATNEKKNFIRDEKKKRNLPINVRMQLQKNRHGQTGKIDFYFFTSKGQFFEQDGYDISPYKNEIIEVEGMTGDDEFDKQWKEW